MANDPVTPGRDRATDAITHLWSVEQVVALAGTSARFGAGEALAVPSKWSRSGVSGRAVWGRYRGSGAEPYDVTVDHVDVRTRCTCPSRQHPCKHAIGLLVLWVRGHLATIAEPNSVAGWVDRERRRLTDRRGRDATASDMASPAPAPAPGVADEDPAPAPEPTGDRADRGRNERIERLVGGLVELDRWLEDRLRVGLGDPSVARFATWDEVARRLTDAHAGALANRVRRLAGKVGSAPDWHEQVLAEIGVLHLLAQAGRRVPALPGALADGVAVACGWQVRKADVEVSAPETDDWLVVGRSDIREDLVEVRRIWLRGVRSRGWAMVLSFAAYRQALDSSLTVGTIVHADVHRYPGSAQRALIGEVYGRGADAVQVHGAARGAATTTLGVCELAGRMLAAEPWLDRLPALVTTAVTRHAGDWLLTDATGSLSIAPGPFRADAIAMMLAASGGAPVTLAVEWTPRGLVPLTVFLDDRAIDIGPRADPSFVSVP